MPSLGQALSRFNVEIPTPRLLTPPDPDEPEQEPGDGEAPHFIKDATVRTPTSSVTLANLTQMHIFSSTATFTLLSPLKHTTLYITTINATAFYNKTEPIGKILYDLPLAVPPGATTTPALPVDWSLGSVGYNAVKDALGGTLKLDTRASVGIRIGQWEQAIWFEGHGIGAHVKI